jgi:hypothetical protein
MMAFANLVDIIPQILKNISFKEYLLNTGYHSLPNKKIKGFECFSKKNNILNDDIIFIGNYNNKEIYYSLLFNDTGSILDFVKNRIEFEDEYETFEPNKDHLIEACRKLITYINDNGESKGNFQYKTENDDVYILQKESFTKYYNAQLIYDFEFLKEFNIEENIINNPVFKGKIFNTKGLLYNDKTMNLNNTAYPLYTFNNKECGLYLENIIKSNKTNDQIDFFAPNSVKSGLWISNNYMEKETFLTKDLKTKTKKYKTKITVVNSPKDALAHFSNLKENRMYLALFEEDTRTYSHIKEIITKENGVLYLASNITVKDFVREIKIILSFLDNQVNLINENYDYITLEIDKKQEDKYDKLFRLIKRNNSLKLEQIIKTLGNSSKEHLAKDLITANLKDSGNVILNVPKNFKTLYHFEKIILNTFSYPFDIIIEKPMYLNWITQNKILRHGINMKEDEETVRHYIEEEKIFILTN